MIKFALLCARGHEFESWFQSGDAFETQAQARLVHCPFCQVTEVSKAIMAPAITSGEKERTEPVVAPAESQVALLDQHDLELRSMIDAVRKRIFDAADDVGARFPEEARKIHNGLLPERPIHGRASFDEARALIEEGVGIWPVPPLPDEHN
ncbi:DUF1178 domain-containing protein [Beijerinckiaceae bacterium]|nr:DUF1178 domain-containing protein [Beijerinckiaceae bacterium]